MNDTNVVVVGGWDTRARAGYNGWGSPACLTDIAVSQYHAGGDPRPLTPRLIDESIASTVSYHNDQVATRSLQAQGINSPTREQIDAEIKRLADGGERVNVGDVNHDGRADFARVIPNHPGRGGWDDIDTGEAIFIPTDTSVQATQMSRGEPITTGAQPLQPIVKSVQDRHVVNKWSPELRADWDSFTRANPRFVAMFNNLAAGDQEVFLDAYLGASGTERRGLEHVMSSPGFAQLSLAEQKAFLQKYKDTPGLRQSVATQDQSYSSLPADQQAAALKAASGSGTLQLPAR